MARFHVELSNHAVKILAHMAERQPKLYRRIAQAIDDLEINPYAGKALKGQLKGLYSYRINRYRIVYEIKCSRLVVYVIDVGHRRDAYR